MKERSWLCTLVTQVSLCVALFVALQLGQPRKSLYRDSSSTGHSDLYFISVRGGLRPLKEQTHLLKLMENVVKSYNVRFVISISELGDDDPLLQNATWILPTLKVPWYTTAAFKWQGPDCILKQIKLQYGTTLDVVLLNTRSLKDAMIMESGGIRDSMLDRLTRKLEAADTDWRVVVGAHPLVACNGNGQMETKDIYEPLRHIFVKSGVNIYLSKQGCYGPVRQDSIAYIGNPGLIDDKSHSVSAGRPSFRKGMANGFLLHRVSQLDMVTYFVTPTGEVVHKITVQQRGKESM